MNELQQAAAIINRSTTGAVATVAGDHLSVQVPGQGCTGGQSYRFFSTVKVRTTRAALRLVHSME